MKKIQIVVRIVGNKKFMFILLSDRKGERTMRFEIEANFKTNREKVWDIVTNNKDYHWRSDLEKIEIVDEIHFIEYNNEKNYTTFTITQKQPYEIYTFTMENQLFLGRWTGIFQEDEKEGTKILFTEEIQIKNPVMRIIALFAMNIKKMQTTYIKDLKRKLGE